MIETIIFYSVMIILLGSAIYVTLRFYNMYVDMKLECEVLKDKERTHQAATRRIKVIASSSYEPEELSKAELADIRWNLIKQLTHKINKKICMEYKAGVYMMEFDVTQIKDESRKSI